MQAKGEPAHDELWQWAYIRGWGRPARDCLERWLAPLPVIQTDDGVNRTWAQIAACAPAGKGASFQ